MKMHFTKEWAWLSLLVLAAWASAGTIDPRKTDKEHLDYGSQFKCVAKILCRRVADNVTAEASCVIISPRWIVTAAHVVEDSQEWTVVCDDGSKHKITAIVTHPDFKASSCGVADIAIGRTEEPFDLDFYPALYEARDEVGKVVSICGYGRPGSFSSGSRAYDGRKRAGSNVIDRVDRGMLLCSVGPARRTSLEFLIAPGDSGGGLFIENSVAGINSIIMVEGRSPSSRHGEESGHTRISDYKTWIEKEMNCE